MTSDYVSASLGESRPSRRRVLAALGTVASMSTAGCGGALLNGNTRSSDESGEVMVENRTTSEAEIAVRVIGDEDDTLFSRVFVLGADEMTSRGAIETTPAKVLTFTAAGISHTWRYDPDLPAGFDCEPKDIGLTLQRDNTIEPWYDC